MGLAILTCSPACFPIVGHAIGHVPVIIERHESLQRILIQSDGGGELPFVTVKIRKMGQRDSQAASVTNVTEYVCALAVTFPSRVWRTTRPLDVAEILQCQRDCRTVVQFAPESQSFRLACCRAIHIAEPQCRDREVVQGAGDGPIVIQLTADCQLALEQFLRGLVVSLRVRQNSRRKESLLARSRIDARRIGQKPAEPKASLGVQTSQVPKLPNANHEVQSTISSPRCQCVFQRRAKVSLLRFHTQHPQWLFRSDEMGLDRFRQSSKVLQVTVGQALQSRQLRPLLDGEMANRFQHAEARFFRGIDSANEALVEKIRQRLLDAGSLSANGAAGIKGPATIEYCERCEQFLLRIGQQGETPFERCAQRSLAWRKVTRPAREKRERIVQAFENGARRKQLHSYRGELDRQRQAGQQIADLGDRRSILWRQLKVRTNRLRTIDEHRRRCCSRQRL